MKNIWVIAALVVGIGFYFKGLNDVSPDESKVAIQLPPQDSQGQKISSQNIVEIKKIQQTATPVEANTNVSDSSDAAIKKKVLEKSTSRHDVFSRQLSKFVQGGLVDYAAWKKEEAILNTYLNAMAQVNDKTLSRDEQMALYINLYNAWTVKLILTHWSDNLKTIKDIDDRWDLKIVKLYGRAVSLDYLEHKMLRPQFKDSRIHFAVNCASIGCPNLWNQAYTGKNLNEELNAARDRFFNDDNKGLNTFKKAGRLYGTNYYVYTSKILSWFDEDFEREVSDGEILTYLKKHSKGENKKFIEAHESNASLKYFDYDWSLNKVK